MTNTCELLRRIIMAVKFDPTVSLGNVITGVMVMGSVIGVWGNIQGELATRAMQIHQLQSDVQRLEVARAQDRQEVKDLIKELKVDLKEVKDIVTKASK